VRHDLPYRLFFGERMNEHEAVGQDLGACEASSRGGLATRACRPFELGNDLRRPVCQTPA
jgi:hypothetical protein